jgi:hypothetical protein
MPALILAQDKRDHRVPAVLVPGEMTVQGTCHEVSDTERQPVDMNLCSWAAVLIPPGARLECRKMRVGLTPVALERRRLMSHKPEGAKARGRIAVLPLPVSFLALELNLGFKADAPSLSRPTAQYVSPPVLALWCLA